MKSKWNEKSAADKTMLVLRLTASIATVIFALLQLFDVWNKAIYVAAPLVGVVILMQSVQERKEHKGTAILGFGCAAFIFVCSVVVWFVK